MAKRWLLAALLLGLMLGRAAAETRLKVVASFSVLADIAAAIAGPAAEVQALVGTNSDAHAFEPSPDSARQLAAAQLVVVNGLGFEGWIERLVATSGYRGPVAVAAQGVTPLATPAGGIDPHAWQDVANGRAYARNIAAALAAADPARADAYRRRAADYDQALANLDREVRAAIEAVPAARRKVVTSHEALRYYGTAYGVTFLAPLGVSSGGQASARTLGQLIQQIRREQVHAVFLENLADPHLLQQLARETGAAIGGTLYTDALSASRGPAPSYIAMLRHNTAQLTAAMQRD